jgi:hypothetical protein
LSLKSYEKEITLLQNNQNIETLFINNEKLMHLSGTESGFEILEAFNQDLKKNIAVIKAIVNIINNPDEIIDINVDIKEIPIVKNGNLEEFLNIRDNKSLTLKIKERLIEEYFGKENKEVQKIFHMYDSKKILKIIYDATDIFEFIKHTSHRVKTDGVAETILKEKHRKIEAWEENHYFDIYNNIYSGKTATVYMEKKTSTVIKRNEETNKFKIEKNPTKMNIDKEFMELLNNSKHLHAIEIDDTSKDGNPIDIEKVKKILKEMSEVATSTDKTFYFKVRKLGRHKAAGLYYSDFDIVAIDVEHDYATAHEWGHHIHLSGGITKEEELKIYSTFNKFNNYMGLEDNKIAYYSSVPEVIARAAEFSYSLYQANFPEIYEAYKNNKEYKGQKITEENFNQTIIDNSTKSAMSWSIKEYASINNENVYFDFKNRTPEELAEFYINFQRVFKYEIEVKKEKNQKKQQTVDYIQQIRKSKRKTAKRRYLKGIESYRIKNIQEILEEYENGNINAMSKSDLITEILISPDFSYGKQLISTFTMESWEKYYSKEEIEEITSNVLKNIAREGVNKKNIKIVKALTPYIPEEMNEIFNIIDYKETKLTEEQILNYYAKFKEGLLIIKNLPSDVNTKEFKQYIDFFKLLKKTGDKFPQVEVEINSDFNISKDAVVEEKTEFGTISQIMITNDNEGNYYLPD